jgi:hypothetical protein
VQRYIEVVRQKLMQMYPKDTDNGTWYRQLEGFHQALVLAPTDKSPNVMSV